MSLIKIKTCKKEVWKGVSFSSISAPNSVSDPIQTVI